MQHLSLFLGKWTDRSWAEVWQTNPWPNFRVDKVYLLSFHLCHPSWHLTPFRCTLGTILHAPILGLLYLLSANHIVVENSSRYYPFGNHLWCQGCLGPVHRGISSLPSRMPAHSSEVWYIFAGWMIEVLGGTWEGLCYSGLEAGWPTCLVYPGLRGFLGHGTCNFITRQVSPAVRGCKE